MKILTQEQLETIKPIIESAGFSGFPPAAEVDWSKPVPMTINVSMGYQKISTTAVAANLTPFN